MGKDSTIDQDQIGKGMGTIHSEGLPGNTNAFALKLGIVSVNQSVAIDDREYTSYLILSSGRRRTKTVG
jgi:hypothetical protein